MRFEGTEIFVATDDLKVAVNAVFPKSVWLNPVAETQWSYTRTTKIIRERVYGVTLAGLDSAMRSLMH
jgi:uncharacterized protein with von Willebrand factor type A (vWA) domain